MTGAFGAGPETTEKLIAERVRTLSGVLDAHAGGLELSEVNGDAVTVRFTGMCTGCPLRTVTMAGLVRPALLQIEGVESVTAPGARISREAEERMARLMSESGSSRLLCAVVPEERKEKEGA
ncbi:MAG TPA: NifU family protein [Thermoleophilaceae bacterium]|nr:NifU family protein [Thermoleophilaceae bacterium]